MKRFLLTFAMLCCTALAFAQQKQVTGTVLDASGVSMPGVTVVVEGTTTGTITDLDGNFSIMASDDATLSISFVGMETAKIQASQSPIKVTLQPSAVALGDVVVVGYGTSNSKDLTAPIVTVKSEDLTKRSVQNPMTALQGQVAGMNVTSTGTPGSEPRIRVRGIGSLNGDGNPLYVVDGMFMSNIDYLNSDDIESVSVLKDASSAAIYGVRAANGVIVVTTKSGKKNQKAVVTYSGYYGFQSVNQRLEMANGEDYTDYQRAIGSTAAIDNIINSFGGYTDPNGNIYPLTNVDWYDEVTESAAPINSQNIGITGGSEKVKYAFGGSFFQQEGISEGTDNFKRFTLRSKVDAELSDLVTIGSNIIVSKIRSKGGATAFGTAYNAAPIMPVYNESNADAFPYKLTDPSALGFASYMGNPMNTILNTNNNISDTYKILPTFYAEFDILKDERLKFRSSYMQELSYINSSNKTPRYYVGPNIHSGYDSDGELTTSLTKTTSNYSNYVWNNILTFSDTKGDHRYTAMLGMEARQNKSQGITATAKGVPEGGDELNYVDLGTQDTETVSDNGARTRGLSYFTRLSYAYKDRYLATATFRADGTSKWGDSRTGYFPSLGLGWVASEENFMAGTSSFLDYFKLRASWGILGNENVPASFGETSVSIGGYSTSGVFGGSVVPGIDIVNTYSVLDWEELHEFNVGFDSRWFSDRLNFTFDWYHRNTPNMVVTLVLPNNQGNILTNYGAMKNTGVDLALGWNDKVGDFSYGVSGTMSFLNNEVTELSGADYLTSSGGKRRHIIGEDVNSYYGYVVEGVYQTQAEIDGRTAVFSRDNTSPGDFKYADLNDDGVIDDNDKTVLGSNIPDFNYGLNLNLGYKNFEFLIDFYGVSGIEVMNLKRRNTDQYSNRNGDADLISNLWTAEGSTNKYPSAVGLTKSRNKVSGDTNMTSFYVEDASYLKIQNIQLGYNLPSSWLDRINIQKWRLYVNVDNPYIFHGYNGFTPEISGGEDSSTYPIAATYTFGMNITF